MSVADILELIMQLRPGLKLRSAVCDTEVVVVRAPSAPVDLGCGGAPLLAEGEALPADLSLDPEQSDGTLLGKRYADEALGVELLCIRGGKGSLTCNGSTLEIKGAKLLPSSD